jgi:hypothetical protein
MKKIKLKKSGFIGVHLWALVFIFGDVPHACEHSLVNIKCVNYQAVLLGVVTMGSRL